MVMPGYKQTEIGVLPDSWDTITFEECFTILPNNTLSRAELNYNGGEVQNIHYGDILVKFPAVLDCSTEGLPYINKENVSKASKGFLHDGDLIMADTAEDVIVGKSTEVIGIGDSKIVSGLHTIPCRPMDAEMFAPKWLGYFINHCTYHDQLIPYITGIKVSSVSKSAISSTVIAVPPKPEQEAIAEALTDIDTLIVNLEKLIAKKKAIKQGAMQELLTGKRRLPGFDGEWKTETWGDVLSGFSSGATPYRGIPAYYKGNIKWVSSGELNYNVIHDTLEHISSEAADKTSLTMHPEGTFLMAITGLEAAGTRGSCALLGAPATTNQSCMAIYIGDDHQIAAHNGLALAVCGGLIVDFLDFFRFQGFAAHGTFLVLAALTVSGGFLVDDPVTGLVSGSIGVITLIGVATAGAGIGGVAHFRASGGGDFLLVVMTQGVDDHSAALGTELGRGAGGRLAGNMARRRVALQPVIAAADAAILDHALAGTGGAGDLGALVPTMAQRVGVIGNKRTAAALADMDGLAAALTGGRGGLGNIVVGQGRRNVLNVPLSAHSALPQGITGAGAGGWDNGGGELMLSLGGSAFLGGAAPLTALQHLAGGFTGGVPDNNTLERMAQGSLIVPLFDLATIYAQIAVIAQGQAGGVHAVQQRPVVVLAAGAVTFCFLGAFVTQMDIGHAVLHHVGVLECVGDLIVHRIVSGLGVIGGAGQGAGIGAMAVADGGGNARLGEIGYSNSVGLSVYHAEIVRHNRLGGGIVGFGISAVGTGIHFHKAVMGQFRPDGRFHVVPLQGGGSFLVGAVAEPAVFTAGNGHTMVAAV